jgi:hypothetical protein
MGDLARHSTGPAAVGESGFLWPDVMMRRSWSGRKMNREEEDEDEDEDKTKNEEEGRIEEGRRTDEGEPRFERKNGKAIEWEE